jgi:hypothetical protein
MYSGSTILADVYSKQIFPNLTINTIIFGLFSEILRTYFYFFTRTVGRKSMTTNAAMTTVEY